jgi:hypothetical protein
MSLDGSYDMVLLPPQRDSDNDGRQLARRRRTRRRLPPVAEEQHPGLSRHPPRRRRRRRGNRGQAGGDTSSAVGPKRVDGTGTPAGDMSGVVLVPETTTGVVSPQHANPKRTDDASTLAKDLLDVNLVPEMTVYSVPNATSPPSIDQEVPSVFHPVPFRFSFDSPSDPASVSSFVKAYPNLLGYHMWSTWDRLTAVSTYGPPGSEEEDDPDSGWDFSRLRDPSAMRDFMTACDYCFSGCSDDGHSLDDEGCDPSRECFHVDLGGRDEGNHLGMPEDDDPPRPASRVDIPRELVVVPVPEGGQDTQLEQIHEMQAKLDEEAGQLVQLRQNTEHSPEKRVIRPRTSSAVSLTMPGQGCPRPPAGSARIWLQQQYCSEQCRSHPPPRGSVSRENSRISWRMPRSNGPKALPPEGKGSPQSIAQRLPDSCGRPRSTPGARGTRRLQPRIASATSTTVATVEPASTRRCAEATTPGVGDATTVRRIRAPRPNHRVRKPSAGPYDGRRSRPSSEPRVPSPSTWGKQGRSCGLRTTCWPASWEEQTMTTSSSATSLCSSPTPPEPSWSICLLSRSPTGTTWSRPSLETSRARTCALGTPGTSEAAASNQGNPCESTSGGFQSSAPSYPTSPTQMSLERSSSAPLAAT